MIPVGLATERLVLDQPGPTDVDTIAAFCTDPLFERYLTTPWPYLRAHAVGFVETHVPHGWANDAEYTWALRAAAGGELLGVIGLRTERRDVGFWLGAPHRGSGYMAEALGAVCTFGFEQLGFADILWECFVGNVASASTARAAGFSYTGVAPALVPARDGSAPPAWHGILRATDPRTPTPGWPISHS